MSGFRSGPGRQAGVQPIDTPEQNLLKDYVFDPNGKIIGGWKVDEVVGHHRDLLPPDWFWDMNVTPPEIVDPEGNRWSPDVMTNEELLVPPDICDT